MKGCDRPVNLAVWIGIGFAMRNASGDTRLLPVTAVEHDQSRVVDPELPPRR